MDLRRAFPNLTPENHAVASPRTDEYNCIAFAAGNQKSLVVARSGRSVVLAAEAAREESVAAFRRAFSSLGYEPVRRLEPEPGYEKVAIYAIGGTPTHAARQLPNGRWASKLGELEDIEHATLDVLVGTVYGDVAIIVRRGVS